MPRLLTDQQEAFAQAFASGKSQADAYREAYPASQKWTAKTLWSKASQLAKHDLVLARVAELRAPAVAAAGMTLESHLAELERLKQLALARNKVDIAVRAEELRGKASGLYITRIEGGEPGAFNKLAAENKQRAIQAVQDEIARRALLDTSVSDVEPKDGSNSVA